MAYIKDHNHLKNFILKFIRQNSDEIEQDQLLSMNQYLAEAFPYADEFSWELRKDPKVLHENNFWEWLKFRKNAAYSLPADAIHEYTPEFIYIISQLEFIPGVYTFWNKYDVCLYVGTSINLAERISQSFKERFRNYHDIVYLRYLSTISCSDACVLEAVYIALFKPAMNKTAKYDDNLTLKLEVPELNNKIACNTPKVKENEIEE